MLYTKENGLLANNSTQPTRTSQTEVKLICTSNFLGRQINVYGSAENPLFLAKEVAEWIDYAKTSQGYYDVSKMVNSVDGEEKYLRTIFVDGRSYEMWLLTEDGLYELLMQSRKPIAKQFKKGIKDILKSIRRTGEYSARNTVKRPTVREKIAVANWLIKTLNLNDSSKLILAKNIAEPLGLPVPDYTPSQDTVKSATELLRENGYGMNARAFNRKLIEKGLMEEVIRNSSRGKKKRFKSLTSAGLDYGENQVHPSNPHETQPLYYVHKFNELVDIICKD